MLITCTFWFQYLQEVGSGREVSSPEHNRSFRFLKMRVVTPQITWHNRDPVLCVDFDPSHSQGGESKDNDFYRLATGGSDTHVLVIFFTEFPAGI